MARSSAVVHLVDDYEPMRDALAGLLRAAGFAPQGHASAETFLRSIEGNKDSAVVADVHLPGMDGVELIRRLRAMGDLRPVIVMSGAADIELAVEAMKAGAADFLKKPFRASVFVAAVRAAIAAGAPPAPSGGQTVYRQVLQTLSPRQRDVLAGIMAGKLNKTIANDLGISVRTVEGYRAEMMARTGARNLSDLVRMGVLADL